MARIAVTQKGRNLMAELAKEAQDDSFTMEQRDTVTYIPETLTTLNQKLTSRTSINKKLGEVIPRHPTINQNIKHNLESLSLDDESTANINSLNMYYANSNFLKNKLAKITNGTSMPNMSIGKTSDSSSIVLPTITTGRESVNRTSVNLLTGVTGDTSFSLHGASPIGEYTDKFRVDLYPKLRQYECKAARLVEKHIANKKEMLRSARKVLDTYNKRAQELNEDTPKAPDFMEGLREKNPEAVDVLLRQTNSLFRKNRRIAAYWEQKYKPCQVKYRDITTKRFQAQLERIQERRAEAL